MIFCLIGITRIFSALHASLSLIAERQIKTPMKATALLPKINLNFVFVFSVYTSTIAAIRYALPTIALFIHIFTIEDDRSSTRLWNLSRLGTIIVRVFSLETIANSNYRSVVLAVRIIDAFCLCNVLHILAILTVSMSEIFDYFVDVFVLLFKSLSTKYFSHIFIIHNRLTRTTVLCINVNNLNIYTII